MTFWLSLILFAIFIAASVFAQLPTTVIGPMSDKARQTWSTIYPQGWQFFTKDPDDEEATVYAVDVDQIYSISKFPNSSLKNFIGFSRAQRAQGTELASIVQKVANWEDCRNIASDCLVAAVEKRTPVQIENPSEIPTICGTVVIMMTVPVPWEYREEFAGWRIDDRAALLEVQCA